MALARWIGFVLLLGSGVISPVRADDPPAAPPPPRDVTKAPAFEEFLVVPLRVHVLSSTDLPDIHCALTDADITRVVGKVNGIWHNAGVHFALEPLVREPAAAQERFKAVIAEKPASDLASYKLLAPEGTRSGQGMDVYYIHKFSVNGVFLGNRMAFVQETARLRPVNGGIDEPLPRVTAHELGHALGLPHRQDRTNLLASGTNGTTLNEAEVTKARARAKSIPGALPVLELRKKAEEATARGDDAEARRLTGWLAEIPGKDKEKKDETPRPGGF